MSMSNGAALEQPNANTSSQWAVDFQLNDCVWGRELNLTPAIDEIPNSNGYFCNFTVFPLGNLDYTDVGFFTHDGYQWRYFGRVSESGIGPDIGLPQRKVVRSQPYVASPYLQGEYYNYDLSGTRVIDNTPYVLPGEGYVRVEPFSTRSYNNDRVITSYERDDHKRRRNMQYYVLHPKGTPERNKRGY